MIQEESNAITLEIFLYCKRRRFKVCLHLFQNLCSVVVLDHCGENGYKAISREALKFRLPTTGPCEKPENPFPHYRENIYCRIKTVVLIYMYAVLGAHLIKC